MPHLTMQTSHTLGKEEAVRRLKEKFSSVRATYQGQVGDLHEQWDGGTLSFGFKTVGMKVAGTVSVGESEVKLNVELPIAAIMFKGMIERRVLDELGDLLA